MGAGVTTLHEDDLVQKCLQCVPFWRMAEGVKNALLNKHSRFLARLYKIICGSIAFMYSFTHGQVKFDILEELSEPGVGSVTELVDPMLPHIYSLCPSSFYLVSLLFCIHFCTVRSRSL